MNIPYNTDRYALRDCQVKVESLFINDVHKSTGVYIFPFHRHDDFLEISLVLEGEELIEFGHDEYTAKAGDMIIKNAGCLHQEIAGFDGDLLELSIGISGVKIDGLPENFLCDENMIPVVTLGDRMDVLRELFYSIYRMYKSSIITYTSTIRLALNSFLSFALQAADIEGKMKPRKQRTKMDKQIVEILQYIDENYTKQISLEDIAKAFYVSSYSLARKFKAETGYSVNQYIQIRRLGMAEQKLAFDDASIKEIAAECGYPNIKYFYSVFKIKTGHTPNEFRKLLRPEFEED